MRSIGRPTAREALLAALAAACGGCASREVPASFPPSSAASERAGEAPPAVVTASLDAEPPLSDDEAGTHAEHGPSTRDASGPTPTQHGGGHHGH